MTKDEFELRTLAATPDAEICILTDSGTWVPIDDLEVSDRRTIVLHPEQPIADAVTP